MNSSANQSNILVEFTKPRKKDDLNIYHVFCITIAVTAFLENSSLCLLHACCKRVRRTNNVFLITHYIANTLQTLTVMAFFVWPSGIEALVCVLNISFSCSVLCIPVISLVTLSKTQWATRYTTYFSGKLSYVLLIVLLCIAVGVAVPPFLGWGSPMLFFEIPSNVSLSYSLFVGGCLSVVPLIITCLTNYKLFTRMRSYKRRTKREIEPQCHRMRKVSFDPRRREGEAKWVVILQIVVFVVCLVPMTVENVPASFVPNKIPDALKYVFNCLAQAYCAISPVLYGFTNREVRRAFKCCCYQKTFVLQDCPRKQTHPRRAQMNEGCYRIDESFVIQRAGLSCDELSGAQDLRERFVRFTGLSMEFSTGVVIDGVSSTQKPAIREKRPITTEVSAIRRHSTLRKQDEAPRIKRKVRDSTKVRFEAELYADQQRKKYVATPSIKRMRRIKKSLSNMSETDLQSSLASLSGSEFESQQHTVPHFTNYSDPMRSAGFRQVLTGKRMRKMARTCSLRRGEKSKPNTRAFMEKRCSIEGDNAIRSGN